MIYRLNEGLQAIDYKYTKSVKNHMANVDQGIKDMHRYGMPGLTHKLNDKDDYYNRNHVGSTNSSKKQRPIFKINTVTKKIDVEDSITHEPSKDDKKREKDTMKFAKRNNAKHDPYVRDAANRNMRRHPERWDGDKPVKPKTESTIFDNIEII